MTKTRPTVEEVHRDGAPGGRHRVLDLPAPARSRVPLDSPGWFAWLAAASTTSFSYPLFDAARGYIVGWMTVSKERRQRGGWYWRVARRVDGRVRKVYLGRSAVVTDARLAAIAAIFREAGERSAAATGPAPSDDEAITMRT